MELVALPNELLLFVIKFLTIQDVVRLQAVSKKFLHICRDNPHWRKRCLQASAMLDRVSLFRQGSDWVDEEASPLSGAVPADTHPLQHHDVLERIGELASIKRQTEYTRIAANWDPTFPGEQTDWYTEFIQRNGPVVTNWFERPESDVRGIALYKPSETEAHLYAASPLDDGSICLWDVKGSRAKKGSILSKSKPGLLWKAIPSAESSTPFIDRGIIECIGINSDKHTASVVVENRYSLLSDLVDIDIQTMTVISTTPFEGMITAISAAASTVPLTVATANGIYLHDLRTGHAPRQGHQERVKPSSSGVGFASRMWQPGPQHIHHMDSSGQPGQVSDDFFVAGRFSNILHYDRRMFPSIKGSLHSGGRLCSLTSLPYPFSSIDSDLRRRLELTEEQVRESKRSCGRTLIACGEYNTKGSLEIYGLSSEHEGPDRNCVSYNSATKNRQTASSSKLLSVINHGNRIVFSDGQGYLKWVERDGFTEVRRHKIGKAETEDNNRSLFGTSPGSDDIARKLLSTRMGTKVGAGTANDDDIVFWTGETLGLINFTSGAGFSPEDFAENKDESEGMAAEEERKYAKQMRLALQRQADEVRFVQNLGMPSR
ncbi:hypothetical protein F4808DRAFT_448774 [Astrocystis sublimbata]|nr:hypothetical protein F4808DRAFT_448774 [Astrocystis sublimbata]